MYENFFKKLTPNDTILTVNQRLTNFLQAEYARYIQLTQKSWPTLDILPISNWLERCWQNAILNSHITPCLLLSSQQEQALWEKIINASIESHPLLSVNATAQTAKYAWQLTRQWLIDINFVAFGQTQDTAAWQSWAREFVSICKSKNWVDNSSLPNQLLELIKNKQFSTPNRLFLVGFDEITPQYQVLLDALDCEYELIAIKMDETHLQTLGLNDTEAELRTMARWAYNLWQRNIIKIGCIIPNLANIRSQVIDIFTEIFTAQAPVSTLPFNIAGGIPLKTYPIIHTALSLLHLRETIEIKHFSSLLKSPYLGFAEQEILLRAELDIALKAMGECYLYWQQIITAAKKNNCMHLANQMHQLSKTINFTNQATQFLTPSEWAIQFAQRLYVMGWPGERSLNSAEYQLVERWKQLLEEFAALDSVFNKIDQSTALQQLNNLATNTLFQPQSTQNSIQILNTVESSGLYFDELWIMGFDDKNWPAAPQPNPFIPYALQRELQMPHANSERELKFAQLITQRLIQSAKKTIISYPKQHADQILQPSRLIPNATIENETSLNLPSYQSATESIFNAGELELLTDDYAPPISNSEILFGGTAIFKIQAACPFQAFARFRLNATDIEQPKLGLNARERGNLLHKALETVWNLISTQAKLLSYSEAELQKIIQKAVNISLTSFIQKRPLTFKQQFTALEKNRLQRLITNWLKLEKARPPFKVLATEKTTEFTLANIPIQIRVDRIDELDDGAQLIIDYKTGSVDNKVWFSERPEEPQLPIYCVADTDTAVHAVAFAEIRGHSVKLKGISSDETSIKGVIPISNYKNENEINDWSALIQHWRTVLNDLGQQFYQGYAKIAPKDEKKNCLNCSLPIFCRLGDANNE